MKDWVCKLYRATMPVRILYLCIAGFVLIISLGSSLYFEYFEHRDWINKRIAENYQKVEEQQSTVLDVILEVVPSQANNYHNPNPEQLRRLRTELSKLSGVVTGVDTVNEDLALASNAYRGSISKLTGAVALYSPSDQESLGELHLAEDRWDQAAQQFAAALERRIGRLSKTLLPSA